jgi:conjugative transfer region protein TrbK
MPAAAKIAGIAALAGMMMTVAIVAAVTPPRASAPSAKAAARPERDPLAPELARCRVSPEPDAGCEAAWETHRRRFFGEEGARP